MKVLLAAASAATIAFVLGTGSVCARSAPDDGLFSMYTVDPGGGFLDLSICSDFGCNPGIEQGFDHICAILESVPSVDGTTMTRDIYILDKRDSASNPMTLTVYRRVDTNGGGPSLSITLIKTLTLDIKGGTSANCKMVENPRYVYLGTDASSHAVRVDRKKLKASVAATGATTLLSVDSRGYVSISDASSGGFKIVDPHGVPVMSGGGATNEVGDQTATVFN